MRKNSRWSDQMQPKFTIPLFKLNRKGMARFLGTLEARIMEIVWKKETVSVQEVCNVMGKGTNYKTVMTVMNRLFEKGFLERKKVSRAFVYSAQVNRAEFLEQASHQIVTGLVSDFPELAMTQFVDVLGEQDPDALATLQKLAKERSKRK